MNSRNKALIITGILVLASAIVAFLVAGWLAGWDFVAFFRSSTFIWICVLVGVYALGVIIILTKDWIQNRL